MRGRGYLLAAQDAWNWVRPRVRWRDAILVGLIGISMLYSVSYYHRSVAAQERQAATQQAAQQRQGEMLEHKLCTTLVKLAALRPPSGSPGMNPSRAYDQQLHTALAQLSPDLGCSR